MRISLCLVLACFATSFSAGPLEAQAGTLPSPPRAAQAEESHVEAQQALEREMVALIAETYGSANGVTLKLVAPETIRPGDSAHGVILKETSEAIYLDASPCQSVKNVIVFLKPATKDQIGPIGCNGKMEFQITKQ